MLEEQKEVVPTATEPETPVTPVEAKNPSDNEPSGEAEGEAPKIENKIDYEAQLREERDARKKAENALARKRFKENREPEPELIEDINEEDKPITKRELAGMLAKNAQDTEKRLMGTQIKAIADDIASTPIEAELIVEIHKNRVWPEHLSLNEQLEEAQLIANKKSIKGKISELARAARGKAGVNVNPAGTHVDAPKAGEPQISATEKLVIAESGFKWNGTARRFEKKLSNGTILIRDPKTKEVRPLGHRSQF